MKKTAMNNKNSCMLHIIRKMENMKVFLIKAYFSANLTFFQ